MAKAPVPIPPDALVAALPPAEVWKDSKGKTKIHVLSCPNFGCHSKWKCSCPSRLATGTVDSTIGKLRSIFNSIGRSGEWSGLTLGNPVAHLSVKKYLASISEEQAKARVSPRKAVPFSSTSSLNCALTFVSGQLIQFENSPCRSVQFVRSC